MSHKSGFRAALAAMLVLSCGMLAFAGKPPALSYQILQLDLVDQDNVAYPTSRAYSITNRYENNTQSQAVGAILGATGGCFAARWTISTADGVQSELQRLVSPAVPGETVSAAASGINDSGMIVGGWDNGQSLGGALLWLPDQAEPVNLPPLDVLGRWSAAYAINNSGVICGASEHAVVMDDVVDHYELRAVVWRVRPSVGGYAVDGPVELPPLSGHAGAWTQAINDIGAGCADVVGSSFQDMDGVHSAVVWTVSWNDDGALIGGPDGVSPSPEYADARGVNDSGVICGEAWTQETVRRAVVWSGGSPQTLQLAKFFYAPAYAHDVNNNGMIVGSAWYHKMYSSWNRAVMWPSAGASMVLLESFLDDNSPFGILCGANAVNDSKDIVGHGWDGSQYTGFVALPK